MGLAEGLVEIEDGRTVYREVSRKAAKVRALIDEVVAFVAANDGCPVSQAKGSFTAGNS